MRETTGNLWKQHELGRWAVITTNGAIRSDGKNVMGRGVALQAKRRFRRLAQDLGSRIRTFGNHVHVFPEYRLITFPVKQDWREQASLELIEQSAAELGKLLNAPDSLAPAADLLDRLTGYNPLAGPIYLVRPGCGNGQRTWEEVKPILERYLDDRFIVIEKGESDGKDGRKKAARKAG